MEGDEPTAVASMSFQPDGSYQLMRKNGSVRTVTFDPMGAQRPTAKECNFSNNGSEISGLTRATSIRNYYDSIIYEGHIKDGKPHGMGTKTWEGGNERYHGFFFEGKRHGAGTYTYSSGSIFIGEYVMNKKHGQGMYRWPAGRTYQGDWQNDCMNG